MITEARGEVMGFSNFFMPVNPHLIRKRRATAGSTPNNKLPNASELAWLRSSMPDNTAIANSPKKSSADKAHVCGHPSLSMLEEGEEEFYDPELALSSQLHAANAVNDIQIDLPNVDEVDDEPDAF